MTAPSAWRPLSEAPKGTVAVVVKSDVYGEVVAYYEPQEGYWFHWYGGLAHEFTGYELYAPIADTYELDRAVQGEIARAFGELLGGLKVASQHEYLARRAHSWSRSAREQSATDHRRNAVSNFRRILHASMGGRIPDEVPHA